MMMSPDGYYDSFIKGKSVDEILLEIEELKNEIKELKECMGENIFMSHASNIESGTITISGIVHPVMPNPALYLKPSPATQLYWNRQYLERARQALVEAGGTYLVSEDEIKAQSFQENLPYIDIIEVETMNYLLGSEELLFVLSKNQIDIKKEKCRYVEKKEKGEWVSHLEEHEVTERTIQKNFPQAQEFFVETMKGLHIGEWERRYKDEEHGMYMVQDGGRWAVKIYFSNGGETVTISGDNAYPYNFNEFLELFEELSSDFSD